MLSIREMPRTSSKSGDKGPTIDSIEVAEFESHAALKEWLGTHGPAFIR